MDAADIGEKYGFLNVRNQNGVQLAYSSDILHTKNMHKRLDSLSRMVDEVNVAYHEIH